MEWTPGGTSGDIEDRRGGGGGFGFGGGGFGGTHIGIGGALVLLILSMVFHRDLFQLFSGVDAGPAAAVSSNPNAPPSTETQFMSFVLDDVQNTWDRMLPQQTGVAYRHAK